MAATEVMIWQIPAHPRSREVCAAMLQGINRVGDRATIQSALNYRRPEGDVGLFYGMAGRLKEALRAYPLAGKPAIYVDLGFWGRKQGGRFAGYHKISVNGRHPTAYFQDRPHDFSRAAVFKLKPEPWRKPDPGAPIILAGMGPKGAHAEGYRPQQWEAQMVKIMRQFTDRPIHYRPKPNWPAATPIPGTVMLNRLAPLEQALAGAHCVVSHHSNTGVEALVAGIPNFTTEGVAVPLSRTDLVKIEDPLLSEHRMQWLADVAWTQFSIAEMASGLAWRHLKEEGLVP